MVFEHFRVGIPTRTTQGRYMNRLEISLANWACNQFSLEATRIIAKLAKHDKSLYPASVTGLCATPEGILQARMSYNPLTIILLPSMFFISDHLVCPMFHQFSVFSMFGI